MREVHAVRRAIPGMRWTGPTIPPARSEVRCFASPTHARQWIPSGALPPAGSPADHADTQVLNSASKAPGVSITAAVARGERVALGTCFTDIVSERAYRCSQEPARGVVERLPGRGLSRLGPTAPLHQTQTP